MTIITLKRFKDLIPNPFSDAVVDSSANTKNQFEAYKIRKRLLLIRMAFAVFLMCCLIIFLSWSQWYFPKKNRKFWAKGLRVELIKLYVDTLFNLPIRVSL